MDYISTKEASVKWGISERRVRALCSAGKIEGVTRCGDWVWSIPADTQKPADGRTLRYMRNRNLRTGSQEYGAVDKQRKTINDKALTSDQMADIICDAMAFDSVDIDKEQVLAIFDLENQKDIALEVQLMVLNMRSALSALPLDLTEKAMLDLHKRLMTSIDEKNGGVFTIKGNQVQETEAMLEQYVGPWSVLHPMARASFLFEEVLRLGPFERGTTEVAFVLLANEMRKAKLPPAIIGKDKIPELKAALASTTIRGNCKGLTAMLIEAVTEE